MSDHPYKLALVVWRDAWFSAQLSVDINLNRSTVGWLVHNNKRIVRIALTYDHERGPADIMNIPRAMVKQIKILDAKLLRDEVADLDEVEPLEDDKIEAKDQY